MKVGVRESGSGGAIAGKEGVKRLGERNEKKLRKKRKWVLTRKIGFWYILQRLLRTKQQQAQRSLRIKGRERR